MKKLSLYIFLVLMFSLFTSHSFAENCPDDMKVEGSDETLKSRVERKYGGYFVPEESYKFGLEIQEAVKNKDLKKLLSLIKHDLISGPKMSFFDGKTFDDAFTESFRSTILSTKPGCAPIGLDKGFILGNGQIWYDKVQYSMFDLRKDLKKYKWFSELSNHEQIKAVFEFETIYGPWSITRITQTK